MAKWNLRGDHMDIEEVLFRINNIIHAKDPKDEAVRFKRDIVRAVYPMKKTEEKATQKTLRKMNDGKTNF
jgi:hypothetical protein